MKEKVTNKLEKNAAELIMLGIFTTVLICSL